MATLEAHHRRRLKERGEGETEILYSGGMADLDERYQPLIPDHDQPLSTLKITITPKKISYQLGQVSLNQCQTRVLNREGRGERTQFQHKGLQYYMAGIYTSAWGSTVVSHMVYRWLCIGKSRWVNEAVRLQANIYNRKAAVRGGTGDSNKKRDGDRQVPGR